METIKTFFNNKNNQILFVVLVVVVVSALVIFFKDETVDFFSTGLKSFSTEAKDYLLQHDGEPPEMTGNQDFGSPHGEYTENTSGDIVDSSALLPTTCVSQEVQDSFQQEQMLVGQNYLSAGELAGLNTTHSSLKNANLDIRAAPSIPKDNSVSPWSTSTIDADTNGLVLA
jgi:hypothetical protein